MKKYIIPIQISLLAGLATLFSGCTKFLEKSNPSSISMNSYYTLPEHATSAVDAIYQDLRSVYDGGGFGGSAWLMLEFPTGLANTIALGSAGPINSSIRMLDMNADNTYLNTFWNSHYRGISNANVALAKIPDIAMDETRKNRLLGEARFLRAYYYFNLVRIFGDIPLITEPLDKSSEQLYPEQTAVTAVYDQIVQDLEWAETAGLPYRDPAGRVSLGAVQSLLSSVYLTMAGYPLQAGVDYYQKARDKALEVINSQQYRLFDTYEELRAKETENTGEYIFMAQYDAAIANRNGFQTLFLPNNLNISLFSDETGMLFPLEEFVASYEPGDKRTEEKQFFYREFTLESNRSQTIDLGDWYIYKWFDHAAHTETAVSGLSWPLLRYAEVLLIYAEAENELTGPGIENYDALNAIRDRADLGALSGLSQDQFREAVWREKWHELCFENKTWFDMARLKKAYDMETDTFVDLVGHQYIYGPTFEKKNLLFPLPTSEILNNTKLIQNPDY